MEESGQLISSNLAVTALFAVVIVAICYHFRALTALRWIAFFPLAVNFILVSNSFFSEIFFFHSFWMGLLWLLFLGVIPGAAGAIPVLIAPNRRIGALIVLGSFILREIVFFTKMGQILEAKDSFGRILVDLLIVAGATAAGWKDNTKAINPATVKS